VDLRGARAKAASSGVRVGRSGVDAGTVAPHTGEEERDAFVRDPQARRDVSAWLEELEQLHRQLRRLRAVSAHLTAAPARERSALGSAPSSAAALQLVPLPGTRSYSAWLDVLASANGSLFADWTRHFHSYVMLERAMRRIATVARHLSSAALYLDLD